MKIIQDSNRFAVTNTRNQIIGHFDTEAQAKTWINGKMDEIRKDRREEAEGIDKEVDQLLDLVNDLRRQSRKIRLSYDDVEAYEDACQAVVYIREGIIAICE